ncbi:MAG TPA: serine/threonine-protein kinase [Blastocatellia bacterium]|nr:serine/threonine-protein kinase [Blastocatellia bacterium]
MDHAQWERIEELLQKALDLEPAKRAAFLDAACAGDASLRREVETLLNKEASAASFIETPAFAHLAGNTTSASLAGQRISHYKIESLIGTGGMGEVYRARDENLSRTVALKMLPADYTADAGRVRRFEQEAVAASKLNHPNIITIFEVINSGGAHFIVSEFIEGKTLRQLMDESTSSNHRLDIKQAIEIAIQVASALKAAHTAWIIHRDIKPENIMVREDGLVKVLDFGIAKLERPDERVMQGDGDSSNHISLAGMLDSSNTMPGAVMGTASYMSPEQARGEPLDGRTDIFSLGAVLYEMVTGERVFQAATRVEAMLAAREKQISLPHHKLDHAPKELERIIRKSLKQNRDERYASAGEMLAELESLKRSMENRASRRIARFSLLALLAVVAFVAIAAMASRGEVWDEQVIRDGHTAAVRRAVFSPDGRLLVSVGEDKQVIVWDFARRERLATFNDHTDWIVAAAFSPDGKWFATAGYDRTVIIWDALNLRKEAVLVGHRGKVTAIAFSPDGSVLVTADMADALEDRETLLWRVGSWEPFARIPIGAYEVHSLLFMPGTTRMIYHIDTHPLADTWDTATGQPVGNQFDPDWAASNAALSPKGDQFAGITSAGEVIFADLKRKRLYSREKAHEDNGRAVAYSPDGRLVATGAENIILWDAITRQKITTIDYPSIVWSATFSPDGRWLVTTHGDGAIRVWDTVERRRVVGFNEHNGPVRAVAWGHDGKRFASAGEDHAVMIWNAESGRREMLLAGHTTRVTGLAFARDDKTLASVDIEGIVIIWDLDQQRERLQFAYPGEMTSCYCIALSPDGSLVATSHGVYETATGKQAAGFTGGRGFNPSSIYGLAFSADGTRLAVAHAQGLEFIWDTATWEMIEQADFSPRQFISVSLAPDFKQMVTGEDGGAIQLWTTHPLRPTYVIGQHAARVKSVAFSPDGEQVVSAGDDKMIALWDVGSRRLITRIGLHTAPVYAVAFSPDGSKLISGGHDGSVRLYTRHRTLWGFRLD